MNKINRRCIVCNSNNYKKLFNMSYEYSKNVLNSDPERKYQWKKDTHHWIVECINCGCSYVPDIIKGLSLDINEKKISSSEFENHLSSFYKNDLLNNLHDVNYNKSILDNLLNILKKKQNVKILDYGSGNAELSIFNSIPSIDSITSYDPLYPHNINEIFKKLNINSEAYNDLSKMKKNEKFDLIICQSVIEHVTYPDQEIKNMKKILSTEGIIYINNPYMPIKDDLNKLLKAKTITKKNRLSCYHIDHINYMTPSTFTKLIKNNDLKVLNFWQKFYSSGREQKLFELFKINLNSFIHYLVDAIGYYYKKQHFFLTHK
jgi:2-polyprenyl-3-methyl-5-hydroxy-6-metoxy-1,4-benzoquinol methylase